MWVPKEDQIRYARNVIFDETKNIEDFGDCDLVLVKNSVVFEFEDNYVDMSIGNESEGLVDSSCDEVHQKSIENNNISNGSVNVDDVIVDALPSCNSMDARPVRERKLPSRFQDYEISTFLSIVDLAYPNLLKKL